MKRKFFDYLVSWSKKSNRKPLVVRGARQVGKTHLIRDFARTHFEHYIEINFDEFPEKKDLFASSDIERVLEYISLDFNTPITLGKTLIFLDEIQCVPDLFAKLRYFYERKPDLHIIAAGSLLDFILASHEFSMPVGRIEYLFVGPMDFYEFLDAYQQENLINFIRNYSLSEAIPKPIHDKLLDFTKKYIAIGGMPAAVREYTQANNWEHSEQELTSIYHTCRDDFSKYQKKIHAERLRMVFDRLPQLVGKKIKYVDIIREERAKDIHQSIQQLQMAKLIYCIHHSSGNALPLRAEKNDKDFKVISLDCGLMMRALNLSIIHLLNDNLLLSNRGAMAEQFIGQQRLYGKISSQEPELYYWNRERKSASAEVDYLFEIKNLIVPVEVKSGTTGSLKSLQVFASEKKSPLAIRFNQDTPSLHDIESSIKTSTAHKFKLLSLPLYMILETDRLSEKLLSDK